MLQIPAGANYALSYPMKEGHRKLDSGFCLGLITLKAAKNSCFVLNSGQKTDRF